MPGTRLSRDERVRIEAWWRAGWTLPAIAAGLGRARSTVWREVGRNNSYRHGPKNPLHRADPGRRSGVYRWG
ncbi:MAG: hypothetical protein JWN54_855, partial [Mycobacterium sp.]|nr:hypothetical protein [Mycobacterium sp.]